MLLRSVDIALMYQAVFQVSGLILKSDVADVALMYLATFQASSLTLRSDVVDIALMYLTTSVPFRLVV